MAVNKKNIMTRYFFVILLMALIGIANTLDSRSESRVCRVLDPAS